MTKFNAMPLQKLPVSSYFPVFGDEEEKMMEEVMEKKMEKELEEMMIT